MAKNASYVTLVDSADCKLPSKKSNISKGNETHVCAVLFPLIARVSSGGESNIGVSLPDERVFLRFRTIMLNSVEPLVHVKSRYVSNWLEKLNRQNSESVSHIMELLNQSFLIPFHWKFVSRKMCKILYLKKNFGDISLISLNKISIDRPG